MKKSEQYFPQLVVGLSSLDEHAQWVHISQAKMDEVYYCPCCKGEIKPRAIKEGQAYHMQPHFYHSSGGCSEETYVHYICKTFLFENGCKFIVNGIEYEVENVEVEKTLSTSFGNYKPDIIVTTTEGKLFYFEIRSTNKKTQHYIPKWDELGNDVVEVNTSDCVNQRFSTGIPEFNLIYSNGECFIKSYTHKDYDEVIAKRKLHWKRQEVLDYKIQWERLDWFWTELQNYATDKSREEIVMKCFNQLKYDDKIWCYENVKKKWCVDLKDKFRDNINQHFFDYVNSFSKEGIKVKIEHISPKIYEVSFKYYFDFYDYGIFEEEIIRTKICKGNLLNLLEINLDVHIHSLKEKIKNGKLLLDMIREIERYEYVQKIKPKSNWYAQNYKISNLYWSIVYCDYIGDKKEKSVIGESDFYSSNLTKFNIDKKYLSFKEEAERDYIVSSYKNKLDNNATFQKIIMQLEEICVDMELSIKTDISWRSDSNFIKRIVIYNNRSPRYEYVLPDELIDGTFEKDMYKKIIEYIDLIQCNFNNSIILLNKIENCKNGLWDYSGDDRYITISLYDEEERHVYESQSIYLGSFNMKEKICKIMNDMLKYVENHKGIRFLEAN